MIGSPIVRHLAVSRDPEEFQYTFLGTIVFPTPDTRRVGFLFALTDVHISRIFQQPLLRFSFTHTQNGAERMTRYGCISKWLDQFTEAVLGRKENGSGEEEVTAERDVIGLYLLYAIAYTVCQVSGTAGVTKTQRWALITLCHRLHRHRGTVPEELALLGNASTSDVRLNNMVRLLRGWADDVLQNVAKEQAAAGKEQFSSNHLLAWDKLPEDGLGGIRLAARSAEPEDSPSASREVMRSLSAVQSATNTPIPPPN